MSKIYNIAKITLDEWKLGFLKALHSSKELFGATQAFRVKTKSKSNPQLRFNTPLFEVWIYALSVLTDEQRNKIIAEKGFVKMWLENDLLENDDDFVDSITDNPNQHLLNCAELFEPNSTQLKTYDENREKYIVFYPESKQGHCKNTYHAFHLDM